MKTVYQNKLFVSIFHEVCLFCCYLHDYDNTSRAQEGDDTHISMKIFQFLRLLTAITAISPLSGLSEVWFFDLYYTEVAARRCS